MEVVFARPSAPCPECGVILRKNQFHLQLFEDPRVEIDVDIRKKILKEYARYNYSTQPITSILVLVQTVQEGIYPPPDMVCIYPPPDMVCP